MTATDWLLTIAASFLLGSIPTGYLIGRARGIDIRKHGSGNIGATNVGRVLGKKAWLLCFAGDFLKGFVPVLASGIIAGLAGQWAPPPFQVMLWCAVFAAAILGHMFTPWLNFKGGKGVATALGSLLGFFPLLTIPGLAALALFVIVIKASRYVSLASISAAAALPLLVLLQTVLTFWMRPDPSSGSNAAGFVLASLTAPISAVLIWRHRSNITRLRAGTEPKAGSAKAAAATT